MFIKLEYIVCNVLRLICEIHPCCCIYLYTSIVCCIHIHIYSLFFLLNSIPLYEWTTVYPFTCGGQVGYSRFWQLGIELLWTFTNKVQYRSLHRHMSPFPWGIYLGGLGLLGHMEILHATFEELTGSFPNDCTILPSHQECLRVPVSLHPLQHLLLFVPFIITSLEAVALVF